MGEAWERPIPTPAKLRQRWDAKTPYQEHMSETRQDGSAGTWADAARPCPRSTYSGACRKPQERISSQDLEEGRSRAARDGQLWMLAFIQAGGVELGETDTSIRRADTNSIAGYAAMSRSWKPGEMESTRNRACLGYPQLELARSLPTPPRRSGRGTLSFTHPGRAAGWNCAHPGSGYAIRPTGVSLLTMPLPGLRKE